MASIDEIKKLFEASDDNVKKGFENLEKEMKDFKEEVKKTVTESLKPTNEKVELLEAKLKEKDEQILLLQRDLDLHKRKNNLVIFGVQESESTTDELDSIICNLLHKVTNVGFVANDFNDVFRLGKRSEKCRPIVVSFVSYRKLRAVLNKKHLFKNENVTVAPDVPKSVMEEKKRLQPMITALNKAGIRATLRFDEVIINGKKLSKEEVEEEMEKFQASLKRRRSPSDESASNERAPIPKLNIRAAVHHSRPQEAAGAGTADSSPPSPTATFSTPSRVFPVFNRPQTSQSGVLSPLPGGSKHSKTFEIRGD